MARLPITLWPDPILTQRAQEVTEFDDELHRLLADMTETMWIEDGVGLAAPQVGVSKRIFITTERDRGQVRAIEVINPLILAAEGEHRMDEGCLSLEGMSFKSVSRPNEIVVEFQDRHGEKHRYAFYGFEARAFQHEKDHLDGKLLIDQLIKKHPEPFRREKWAKQIQDSYAQKQARMARLKAMRSPATQKVAAVMGALAMDTGTREL